MIPEIKLLIDLGSKSKWSHEFSRIFSRPSYLVRGPVTMLRNHNYVTLIYLSVHCSLLRWSSKTKVNLPSIMN